MNWHGESTGGRGVLKPGETAIASVTGIIGESFLNDVFVVYQLRGDSLGTMPHAEPGHVKIRNFGLANTWVSVGNSTGSLMNNQTAVVPVNLSAAGLVPATYRCNLVVRDLYNNRFVIPVTMHVTFPVEVDDKKIITETQLFGNFPNPFSGTTQMRYDLPSTMDVTLEIFSLQGMLIRSWMLSNLQPGSHSLEWDGKDELGMQVPAGIYTCRMKARDFLGSVKMVLIR